MRFILVRHGETPWNVTGQYQGQADIPLSERGRAQAAALGKRFESIHVDEIFSSPLQRAYDTARPISEATGRPIHVVDGLKELDFGQWDKRRKCRALRRGVYKLSDRAVSLSHVGRGNLK